MSNNPDTGATATGIQFTRQLSQRDLSLQIPVNYVTVPGVVLTQACFAHNRYEDAAAARCFSNLLAVGFQRFEIDIYWDVTRQVWSLCPVELGTPNPGTNLTLRAVAPLLPYSLEGISAVSEDAFGGDLHQGDDHAYEVHERQEAASSSEALLSETTGTSLGSSSPTKQTSTITSQSPTNSQTSEASPTPTNGVFNIGLYTCSSTTNFQALVNILLLHLGESQTNVNATLKYLTMNLHAATPASDPTGPANELALDTIPQGNKALSYILDQSMAQYLYTPDDLADQRSDLNSSQSWFAVVRSDEPDSAYFNVKNGGGNSYTPNGWPSASFVEMNRAKRLFAGFGSIDPKMQRYNLSADKSIIFPAGYMQTPISNDDHLKSDSQCFFDANDRTVSNNNNNSWALAWEKSGATQTFSDASDSTLCGISPVLNTTLEGVTADQDFQPYRTFVQKTIWSWAPDQPQHALGEDASGLANRCAVLNAGSGYWESEDCSQSHYSACMQGGQPYQWLIGDTHTSYDRAELPCPDGSVFTAPRTALENRYLLHHWRHARTEQNIDDKLLWVNFNDLDVNGCWVVGQNVTCPYLDQGGDDKDIAVPTVAAVIVFAVAALTVFVKCAANRQRSKRRRRRGDDGWDYEGVPS